MIRRAVEADQQALRGLWEEFERACGAALAGASAWPAVRTAVQRALDWERRLDEAVVIDRAAEERLDKAMEEIRNRSADGWDRPLTMAEKQDAIEIQRQFLSSREEIEAWIGKSIDEVNADSPEALEYYARAFAGEPTEATMVTGGRTVQAHLLPLHDDAGEVDGVVGVATDITDLARAQSQLSESEARHSVVLNALHEGVLMIDRLGRVLG